MRTLTNLLFGIVCRFLGHRMKRVTLSTPIFDMGQRVGTASARINRCTRCGLTKPVRTRKTKGGGK